MLFAEGVGKGAAWQKRMCMLFLSLLFLEMLTFSVSSSTADWDKASPCLKRGVEMDGTGDLTKQVDLSGSA